MATVLRMKLQITIAENRRHLVIQTQFGLMVQDLRAEFTTLLRRNLGRVAIDITMELADGK